MSEFIASPSKTMEIIKQYKFNLKKKLGQNFLTDINIIHKIVATAQLEEGSSVLEIGPGIGSLTQALAQHAKKVICVEIDKFLIPLLAETLKDCQNVTIVNEDILKFDITGYLTANNITSAKVVANLPYYITTPIIMGILESRPPVSSMTVMVQKEVCDRFNAQPGTKDYGALTIAAAYYAKTMVAFDVPPSCFIPKPAVSSAVIHMDILEKPSVSVKDERLFFCIIKSAFGQRRKTLLNSLHNQLSITKEALADIFATVGLDGMVRGERLSLADFAVLSNEVYLFLESLRAH